ncbi:DUF87 domain-containing protein [Shimazuella sp. AN120528]|uniref:helicase HerA domain-containing protein n=1 Tax=Shimazuella soli TaxID=1892854 RepID=UPI001F0EE988|nr:DUF87 domain-containing protein [Shimazuella soli]MCH5585685.1 DUF87 domain-containing protein [Shimazuella soli]
MSWLKMPKGGPDDLAKIPRYVLFYAVLPLAFLFLLKEIWDFLQPRLEGKSPDTSQAVSSVNSTMQASGDLILSWLPTVILILVCIPLLYILIRWLMVMYYRRQAIKGVRYLRILPADNIELEIDKITMMTRTFGGMIRHLTRRIQFGNPWFRIRFAIPTGSNEIGIYMAYPKDKKNSVFDTIQSVYPSAEIHEITKEQFPEPENSGSGGIFTFQLGKRKGLPLASLEQKKESPIGNILNSLRPGTFLDIQFSPVSWSKLEDRSEDVMDSFKDKKISEMEPEEKARRISLMKRLTGRELSFKVRLSLWSNHEHAVSIVRSSANAIETAMNYDGAIRFWPQKLWNPLKDKNPVPYPYPSSFMIWDGNELANLFHLPPSTHWIYKEPEKMDKNSRGFLLHLVNDQRTLEDNELNEGVLIGVAKHPLHAREVRISYNQLTKHFLLSGTSGMGRSSASTQIIQSMIDDWLKDPDNHPGFTILDPAREMIPIIENRLRFLEENGEKIPKEKIHHFNLSSDTSHVVGLNLLANPNEIPIDQIAEQIAEVLLHKHGKSESLTRMKRLLTLAVHSLMEHDERHTILCVDEFFRDPTFRTKIVQKGKDPYVKRFWTKLDQQELKREVEGILNHIDPLLQDPTMRRMYLQKEMTLDINKYLNEGHLVFFDLDGMKDHELKVTVGQLVNHYYQAAIKRPVGAKFHLMMIDEAHLIQIPLFTEIFLSDDKCDLGIGLITREIDQFNNEELMQAMKGNIGMIISCAQLEGADEIEDLTRNHLKASFVEKLAERTAAVYIHSKKNQRKTVTTCVVSNLPPSVFQPDGKIANYKTNERKEAFKWGLDWGIKRMIESGEAREVEELDKEISHYMEQQRQELT